MKEMLSVVLLMVFAFYAYAIEPSGYKGMISGCGINWYWIVGNFENAKTLKDACSQVDQHHANDARKAEPLVLYSIKGELKKGGKCFYAANEGLCGTIETIMMNCPQNSQTLDESTSCICNKNYYERIDQCIPGNPKCDEMVSHLQSLNINSSDPRYGFYRNQTCIAKQSCAARSIMEDKDWLN